jgi:hypothetical protein
LGFGPCLKQPSKYIAQRQKKQQLSGIILGADERKTGFAVIRNTLIYNMIRMLFQANSAKFTAC